MAYMSRYGAPYQTATALQRTLVTKLQDPETNGMATAQMARAWIEIEQLKGELREKSRARAAARPRRTLELVEAEVEEVERKSTFPPDPVRSLPPPR